MTATCNFCNQVGDVCEVRFGSEAWLVCEACFRQMIRKPRLRRDARPLGVSWHESDHYGMTDGDGRSRIDTDHHRGNRSGTSHGDSCGGSRTSG